MFNYDDSGIKGLSSHTYQCSDVDIVIIKAKLTVVNGKLFVTSKADEVVTVSQEFGVGFEDRNILVVGDQYFLLDKDNPEISPSAFKRPETKESIKARAMNKLSKEEREALGL